MLMFRSVMVKCNNRIINCFSFINILSNCKSSSVYRKTLPSVCLLSVKGCSLQINPLVVACVDSKCAWTCLRQLFCDRKLKLIVNASSRQEDSPHPSSLHSQMIVFFSSLSLSSLLHHLCAPV